MLEEQQVMGLLLLYLTLEDLGMQLDHLLIMNLIVTLMKYLSQVTVTIITLIMYLTMII